MGRLNQKTIIITGATSGIGEAAARICLKEGANILIHGLNQEEGMALTKELGPATQYCHEDLIDPKAPERIVQSAVSHFGRIDGIVNNAALVSRSNLETTSAQLFDRFMAINVRAPMLIIKAARTYLRAARGSVVNIGSINAYTGEPGLMDYATSKGALVTLSRNLSDGLGQEGIRVNVLNPGWILTKNEYTRKVSDGLPKDWPEQLDKYEIPNGKMTTPEEVAQHILFWLSDESRPISGTVLELNQYPFLGRMVSKEGDL